MTTVMVITNQRLIEFSFDKYETAYEFAKQMFGGRENFDILSRGRVGGDEIVLIGKVK